MCDFCVASVLVGRCLRLKKREAILCETEVQRGPNDAAQQVLECCRGVEQMYKKECRPERHRIKWSECAEKFSITTRGAESSREEVAVSEMEPLDAPEVLGDEYSADGIVSL